ncbi:growth hormone secretagogue receptor type 1-like [Gigantopelta aegis]|uniref:growth hormone secretagogue receptor type 1-like n=1 Tax=Gigantopelta aegis TaxID=1735272 RepID=UPI001B88A96E|nr:growth hormone secretagogue receptor type 1-like [Gigantopelta aegis]
MITLPFRTMTWSIILTGLAIVDTIMLCAIAINKPFVIDMMGMDVLAISNAGCKTFHFVRRAAKMASSWLVVVICIERFFAICYPLKVKKICTRHNTIAAMVVIGSVAITFSGLSTENVGVRGSACLPSIATNETRVQGKVMLLLGSSLSGVAPMLILITLTPIICWTLVRHRRARTVMTSSAKLADPYTRVSAMLVSVHMSYIILVLPMFVDINLKFMRPFSAAVYDEEIMEVFGKFSRICEMINHSINFFLYVGFNSLFRRRLAQAFSRSVSVDRSNADLMG